MSTQPDKKSSSGFPRDAEEARLDIELTREELGETVQALAHKINVPERLKEQTRMRKDQAAKKVRETLPAPVADRVEHAAGVAQRNPAAVVGGLFVILFILRMLSRRRNR